MRRSEVWLSEFGFVLELELEIISAMWMGLYMYLEHRFSFLRNLIG